MDDFQALTDQMIITTKDFGLIGPVKEVWSWNYFYRSENLQRVWEEEEEGWYFDNEGEWEAPEVWSSWM